MRIDLFGYALKVGYVREGDGESDGESSETPVFTQEQVNSMIGKRVHATKTEFDEYKKAAEAEKKELVTKLEKMRETQGLSAADKDALTQQINELQGSLQSKEEQQKSELQRLKSEYDNKLTSVTDEAKTYKRRFESQAISTALLSAAANEGALNPQQIQAMYSNSVKLVQDRDAENELLESFTPMLSFVGIDKKTKAPVPMELPVGEALKKIREDGLNANLFKGHQKGGSGTSPLVRDADGKPELTANRPPRKVDYESTQAWMEARDAWKEKFSK